MCRDDYPAYARAVRRELSEAGFPIYRMRRIVVAYGYDPQLAEVCRQAERVRDHLLSTWSGDQKIVHLYSLAGRELKVAVLREPQLPFEDDLERDLFDGVVLRLTLDARVVLDYGTEGFELFDTFDAEDVAVMAPRILRILSFNS